MDDLVGIANWEFIGPDNYFRPGTIATMGFGYDALRELNRGIIMVNVSAYGQYGPYQDRIGFDPIG
ncbi:hypothetical protein NKDENANG_02812 [Candidatus Entotheonellaceae bacterium PAL068K]